jgi:superfamily II DNA or RNA helicase
MESIASFHSKTLQQAKSLAEYNLYKAAIEWDLIEPIVIDSINDLQSDKTWKDLVKPYHHQVKNLITFCSRIPVTLLADDVGLGKTISAGLIASELISRGRITKILIVCPKLLIHQWCEELSSKFCMLAQEVRGVDLETMKLPEEASAIITTYQSARSHFDAIEKIGFDMLILDEAHKLRNLYGVEKPPKVAEKFYQALTNRVFKYVLMLTATPLQNRLWDIYSLIDLLTAARGHPNPFGSQGMFASKFIAGSSKQARRLRPEMRDEFRSVVYGYMSRVRRVDVNLQFPDRIVLLHKVVPTPEEKEIFTLIAEPIQKLHPLAQITVLQALVSSPHALAAQLENMADHETVPRQLAVAVRTIVRNMRTTAKLQGLGTLIDELKKDQPEHWRMVIFTCRRETQTSIEEFLREREILCGLINGDSGSRNQQTLTEFKKNPPEMHVIVSTEAGAEGINLQVANVLVNYDLPWNPMVVEQRIGRIQRLSSEHAIVCIFNIILQNTFEEYIVGRLMEKLQMISHAVGDIESLLEAAGLDKDEESENFSEKIRKLVIASLSGNDVEQEVRLAEKSIADAKIELERGKKKIDEVLGGSNDIVDFGPKRPKLPHQIRSIDAKSFTIAALESLGGHLLLQPSGAYLLEKDGQHDLIYLDDIKNGDSINPAMVYKPHTRTFERLVSRMTSRAFYQVMDLDQDLIAQAQTISEKWVNSFSGIFCSYHIENVQRCFNGTALLRVRVIVACDSYERLIEIPCSPVNTDQAMNLQDIETLSLSLDPLSAFHLSTTYLTAEVMKDNGVSEFCRFYKERLVEEVKAAGNDEFKRKKLMDDFTPGMEITLAAMEGTMFRQLQLQIIYKIESDVSYKSLITVIPSASEILYQPETGVCSITGRVVPSDCLGQCQISGKMALKHMLIRSEVSDRMALPEYSVKCALSGKRVLSDEVEKSAVTGRMITSAMLKTSAMSGKRAEPEFFGRCEFTSCEVLENELAISQISGKRYRIDEQLTSAVSGKTGHQQEFIHCAVTNQPLLAMESEGCEITGKAVMPGLLVRCEVTGKKVLPSELEMSAISGKKALKSLFVSSSLSSIRLLEQEAVRSATGKYCAPFETRTCFWSGRQCHPDDLRTCELTGVVINFEYTEPNKKPHSEVLIRLLTGMNRKVEKSGIWNTIEAQTSVLTGYRNCAVKASELSPDGQRLAVCLEIRAWMGLKIRLAGLFYSIPDNAIIGRISIGKCTAKD